MKRHDCKGDLCGICNERIDAIEDAQLFGADPDDADHEADRYFGD